MTLHVILLLKQIFEFILNAFFFSGIFVLQKVQAL